MKITNAKLKSMKLHEQVQFLLNDQRDNYKIKGEFIVEYRTDLMHLPILFSKNNPKSRDDFVKIGSLYPDDMTLVTMMDQDKLITKSIADLLWSMCIYFQNEYSRGDYNKKNLGDF